LGSGTVQSTTNQGPSTLAQQSTDQHTLGIPTE